MITKCYRPFGAKVDIDIYRENCISICSYHTFRL